MLQLVPAYASKAEINLNWLIDFAANVSIIATIWQSMLTDWVIPLTDHHTSIERITNSTILISRKLKCCISFKYIICLLLINDKLNLMDIFGWIYHFHWWSDSCGKESGFQGLNKLLADYVTWYYHHWNSLPTSSWKRKQDSTNGELYFLFVTRT